MTPQEQQLLEDFLSRLAGVRGVAKDPQADALIRQRLADQPDALYLLVQRSILLDRALENAKAQIAQLQAQQQGGGSFLGDQPHGGWAGNSGAAMPPPMPSAPPPAPPPAPSSWRERFFGGAPAPAPAPAGGQPSFLASAATTAAGVAGGMFLFNGIENLLGGHQGGGFFGGGEPQQTVVENITNNTFLDDGQGQDSGFADNGFDQGGNFDDGGDFGGFDDDGSWS